MNQGNAEQLTRGKNYSQTGNVKRFLIEYSVLLATLFNTFI